MRTARTDVVYLGTRHNTLAFAAFSAGCMVLQPAAFTLNDSRIAYVPLVLDAFDLQPARLNDAT